MNDTRTGGSPRTAPARPVGPEARGRAVSGGRAPEAGRGQPQRWKGAVFALAALAIVAGAVWALLGSRFLVVRSVRVTGTSALVTQSRVLAAAHVRKGIPMIRVNGAEIALRVRRIRQVASVTVSRHWPDTVVIAVRPRTAVFAVGSPGHFRLVDISGVTVSRSARRPASLPLLTLSPAGRTAPVTGNPAIHAAAVVMSELPAGIAGEVRSVSAPGPSDISVTLTDGVVVVWGSTAHPAEKAKVLTALMRTHAHTYDVSAPGTAVTRG